ncbi:DUF3179 domain-containing protein [Vibrio sp. Of7-15]|uniref:DUF3179 domain-containing protein n=1 Tax=Vibrio sp. Of7-15 TaxID=2724879 RepID=UPI001EF17DB9|nr:DUF3179 domain-containing protein [Vibrio sp. Of7-15]MCG7496592.1 DUF3179 domain-containing protein [Vibrio sp. Of7-15]
MKVLSPLFIAFVIMLFHPISHAKNLNGFDLSRTTIPAEEILHGGPAKDGIPALLTPVFQKGLRALDIHPNDKVFGLVIDGIAKAYPIKILNWHEVVNDKFNESAVIVSYCPLCGSGMAFSSDVGYDMLTFGVSGLVYNSDVLMYDHQSNSLWSQIRGEAVSGSMRGKSLHQIPLQLMRWKKWLKANPDTLVLSTKTGFKRNYNIDPYQGYKRSPSLFFPVSETAPKQYFPKQLVLGFKSDAGPVAFSLSELQRHNQISFTYQIANHTYMVHWNKKDQAAWITDLQGAEIPTTLMYWFAWYTFYPETKVFLASNN